MSTIAGTGSVGCANGPGDYATFFAPQYLTFDNHRNIIIVMDIGNNVIRTIYNPTPSSQPTQQPSTHPTFQPISRPTRLPSSQPTDRPTGFRGLEVYTLAGGGLTGTKNGSTNAVGTNALFNNPMGGSVNIVTGDLYVADYGNNLIRKVTSLGDLDFHTSIRHYFEYCFVIYCKNNRCSNSCCGPIRCGICRWNWI